MSQWLSEAVTRLAEALCTRGQRIAVAESCTGGLLAATLTQLAGSSVWFDRGFVTYSNEAKTDLLGVPAKLIARHGAVSEAVVRAMALGARMRSGAQWAVAITGIAGPGGGSAEKPVGTVWMAWAGPEGAILCQCLHLPGSREAVREGAVREAIEGLLRQLGE
jgi:nicotinamide-nucleotide amidase